MLEIIFNCYYFNIYKRLAERLMPERCIFSSNKCQKFNILMNRGMILMEVEEGMVDPNLQR